MKLFPAFNLCSHFPLCLKTLFLECQWLTPSCGSVLSLHVTPSGGHSDHQVKTRPSFLLNTTLFSQSVQSLSHVRLFATRGLQHTRFPGPSPTHSLLKLMSIEPVMPSNHLILCHPLLLPPSIFPSIRVFPNESGGQRIGVSASASVLSMNIQD